MQNSAAWYNGATIGYFIALFLYIFNLALKRSLVRRFATCLTALAFLAQTVGMIFRWIQAGDVEVAAMERATGQALEGIAYWVVYTQHPPWSNLYEIMVYMSFGIILVFLVVEVKWRIRFLGVFALLLALAALGLASLTDGMIKPLVPALKSWWIMVHVISASVAYAAGTIGAILSLFFIVKASNKVSITALCAGTMGLSAFLFFLLGRGLALFDGFEYRVKLLRHMGEEHIQVGRLVGDKFVPYYVASPGVGILLALCVFLSVIACVLLWRQRKVQDVPQDGARWAFILAFIAMLSTLGLIIVNDFSGISPFVNPQDLASLMPPGPWNISLKSHTWDVGLFGIILLMQVFALSCAIFPAQIRGLLPAAETLDRTAYATIIVAFALVAVVLVTGALWAHYAWGRYWAWDPKETGALIIWLTYALYLHTRVTYGLSGVFSAVIGIFAFFVILAGFLGVNLGFFAEGLHSYGSS